MSAVAHEPGLQKTAQPHDGAEREPRIPALDGVRGVAILLVLILHATKLQPQWWGDELLSRLAASGWCGVDLFFVLSGFLITGILYDSKGSSRYFRNFYMRRVLRIFPLYYGMLAFFFIALPLVHRAPQAVAGEEWWYWLYLSNYSIALRQGGFTHAELGVSWSLAIEEQFYIVWPAVVWLLGRAALLRLCIALVIAAVALRTTLVLAGAPGVVNYVLTPTRIDSLAIGAIGALLVRGPGGVAAARPVARLALWGGGTLVAAMLVYQGGHLYQNLWMTQTIGFTALAVFFGGAIVLAAGAKGGAAHWVLTSALLCTLGKFSYAIYLTHTPVIRGASWLYPAEKYPTLLGSQLPGQMLFYVLAIGACLGAGWLSWHVFEKHFLKLKRFFPRGQHAPAAAVQPAAATSWGSPG